VSDVNVRFGGDTRGLDAATRRAKADITSLRPAVQGLQGTLGGLKDQISSSFNLPDLGAARSAIGGLTSGLGGVTTAAGTAAAALGLVTVAVVAIGAAVAGPLLAFGAKMGDIAEKTDQIASKLGMATSEVSQWSAVAGMAGMTTEQWSSAMTRLARAQVMAANGGKQQTAAFAELGITISETTTQNELMLQMADKFSKMEDGPKKVTLAMATMGRAGAELIPILNQGRDALKEQMDLAESYGAVLSDDLVAAGLRVDDAMDEMNLGMQGIRNTMFEALAPVIEVVVEGLNNMIRAFIDSYRSGGIARQALDLVGVGLRAIVSVIDTVIVAFSQMYYAAMAALNPIIGLLRAVGSAMGDALSGNWSGMWDRFQGNMASTARSTIGYYNAMGNAGTDWWNRQKRLWGTAAPSSPRSRPTGSGDFDIEGFGPGGGSSRSSRGGAEAKAAARERLQAALEELEFRKDMARDDFEEQMRLEDQKIELIRQAYGEGSREYVKALRDREKMQRDHNQVVVQMERQRLQHQLQLDQISADTERQLGETRLAEKRQRIEFEASLGRLSDQEKLAALAAVDEEEYQLEVELSRRIYQLRLGELQSELALQNLRPQERQRVLNDIAVLEAQHNQQMAALGARHNQQMAQNARDAATASVNAWKSVTQPITSALSSAFQQLYNRQTTFKQAMLQVADSIIMHWAQKGIEMVGDWAASLLAKKAITAATTTAETGLVVAGEAVKTAATATGAATRVGLETTAAAATKSITIGSVLTEIGAKAANAAAGAYAAIAAIPVVGPFLAPAMAAAAFAGVIALGKSVFSAEGGWDKVPYDGAMTELHKNEMVLPAKFANPLRKSLAGGWSPGPMGAAAGMAAEAGAATRGSLVDNSKKSGDVNFNYQPSHSNMGASMETLLKEDGRTLRKWIKNEMRNGGLSFR